MFTRKSMAALGRRPPHEALASPAHNILIIMDDVRSMHNVGSAFRTADAFGLAGIYLCGFTPVPPHRDIRKTALGAEESVRWQYFKTIGEALANAQEDGYQLVAIEQAADSEPLQQIASGGAQKLALIFGNEVTGVSDAALARVSRCIEIPQWGAKHSLNISVSIGVVLWEIVRMHAV
jgi:23S rRNA (guanosine2251-2'-O)-methyltransferase